MPRTLTRPITAIVVVALLATACGEDRAPSDQLADAVEALGDTSFSYALTLDLESTVAERMLGADMAMLGQAVNSLALEGTKAGGQFSFSATLMGFEPLTLRRYEAGEELYLRLGLGEILGAFGADLDALGLSREALAELPGDAGVLMERLLAGEWVGFVGLEPEESTPELEEFQGRVVERLSNLGQFLRDTASVTRTEDDDATRFDIVIDTEAALREFQAILAPLTDALDDTGGPGDLEADIQEMLAGAPASIPGLGATITGGNLTEVTLDVSVLLAAVDESYKDLAPGDIVLRLVFTEHGAAAVPAKPAEALTFDQEQLDQLTELLSDPSSLLSESVSGSDTVTSPTSGAESQAAVLVSMELAWFEEHDRYTDDLAALFESASEMNRGLLDPNAMFGACVFEDGQGFVVGAALDGQRSFYDSNFVAHPDAAELPCQPELDVAPPA